MNLENTYAQTPTFPLAHAALSQTSYTARRCGKIARLPFEIRQQINSMLSDGIPGTPLHLQPRLQLTPTT